jgi:RNA polymerase sigma-70 factor (ECF subfamily)
LSAAKEASVMPDESPAESDIARAVEAVLDGHPNAFALIVRRFQDSLMTVATALLRDRQAADELTQDAFVRAFQRLRSYDASRPMKPWLVKIACRLAQDRWRGRAAAARQRQLAAQEADRTPVNADPLDSLIADERDRTLWRMVQTLPVAERTAVILYYREGLSVDEAAEATGVAAGTVKTLLFRARSHLRDLLTEQEPRRSERSDP